MCREITVNTKYPSSLAITDAARAIVREYTYLRETIGTGYGGWRQSIRDRLKNIRRCDQSEEVKSRKKVVKSAASSLKHIERSSNPATDDLSSHLRETFEVRRNEIVSQKVKIEDLRRKYPNLFAKKELDEEFFRITGKKIFFSVFQTSCNYIVHS